MSSSVDQVDSTVPIVAAAVPPPGAAVAAGRRRRTLRRLVANRGAVIAGGFLLLILLVAIFGPLLAPFDPTASTDAGTFASPSWSHWLGTDNRGRDNLSRLVLATRVSVFTTFSVVAAAALVAVPIGLVAGFYRGRVENILMRIVDAGLAFPPLILALAVAGVLGPGTRNAAIALAIVYTPGLVRLVRGQAVAVREETFIEASRGMGTPARRVLRTRMFGNVRSAMLVQLSLMSGSALLAEASLSYLGLGAVPPTPSWGNMLRNAYNSSLFTQQWQLFAPGLAIAATVLAFNTFGEGLRDALGVVPTKRNGRWGRRGITDVARVATKRGGAAAPTATPIALVPRAADAAPAPAGTLLEVKGLTVEIASGRGTVRVVDDVSFTIGRSEVVGLVGESGCGKSVTAQSIMRLLPSPPVRIAGGSIQLDGRNLLELSFHEMRKVRGADVAMIFQDPMTSLDPSFTIGSQLIEAQRLHADIGKKDARKRAVELLDMVGIPAAAERVDDFPHHLSGGMRQRAMIAIALACRPKLLIADEPTTALDVTVQAQVLDLLKSLQSEFAMSILLVTHDLGVVADICDRVAVMYAGQIIEEQPVHTLFEHPRHPYTSGLLHAMPQVGQSSQRLAVIPGRVPLPEDFPHGCRFRPRCAFAEAVCGEPVRLDVTRAPGTDSPLRVRCVRSNALELTGSGHHG